MMCTLIFRRHVPLCLGLAITACALTCDAATPPANKEQKEEESFYELADSKARLVGETAAISQRIAENKRKQPNIKFTEDRITERKADLERLAKDMAKNESDQSLDSQKRMEQAEALNLRKIRAEQEIKVLQDQLEGNNSNLLQTAIATDEALLAKKQVEQQDVEKRILAMRTPAQDFKVYVSLTFAFLIAIVIIGFFVIAYIDGSVRGAIFSGQGGIQFLTLFSLVIAIILFGVTGILEGKELSALLGGLSGYILGRSMAGGSDNGSAASGTGGASGGQGTGART